MLTSHWVGENAMIHIALRVAYMLFLAWLGLNVLLLDRARRGVVIQETIGLGRRGSARILDRSMHFQRQTDEP